MKWYERTLPCFLFIIQGYPGPLGHLTHYTPLRTRTCRNTPAGHALRFGGVVRVQPLNSEYIDVLRYGLVRYRLVGARYMAVTRGTGSPSVYRCYPGLRSPSTRPENEVYSVEGRSSWLPRVGLDAHLRQLTTKKSKTVDKNNAPRARLAHAHERLIIHVTRTDV